MAARLRPAGLFAGGSQSPASGATSPPAPPRGSPHVTEPSKPQLGVVRTPASRQPLRNHFTVLKYSGPTRAATARRRGAT